MKTYGGVKVEVKALLTLTLDGEEFHTTTVSYPHKQEVVQTEYLAKNNSCLLTKLNPGRRFRSMSF
jgi:hypothetical protein